MFIYHNYWIVGLTVASAITLYFLRNKLPQWMYILEWTAFLTVAIALI